MATQVWLIRHGEVEAPYVGTFVGTKDVALSKLGEHQAEAIAAYLEPAKLDAMLVSPRQRARQTAAPTAKMHGLQPTIVDDLAEMDFGQWEGRGWDDIQAEDPAFAAGWQDDPGSIPCPGGECANDFAVRVQACLRDIVAAHEGQTVAIFGHAGTNRAALAMATPGSYMDTFAFAQDYGCINAMAFGDGAAQVALWNLVPGPRSEDNGDGGRAVAE